MQEPSTTSSFLLLLGRRGLKGLTRLRRTMTVAAAMNQVPGYLMLVFVCLIFVCVLSPRVCILVLFAIHRMFPVSFCLVFWASDFLEMELQGSNTEKDPTDRLDMIDVLHRPTTMRTAQCTHRILWCL